MRARKGFRGWLAVPMLFALAAAASAAQRRRPEATRDTPTPPRRAESWRGRPRSIARDSLPD